MNETPASVITIIKRHLVGLQNKMLLKIIVIGRKRALGENLVRLGSAYGGWWVEKEILEDGRQDKSLISAGLGNDVSFDREMLRYGFSVLGLDPIPESTQYAKLNLLGDSRVDILTFGLWTTSGQLTFFPPTDSSNASWSIEKNSERSTNSAVALPVIALDQLLKDYSHIRMSSYRYLKMDIEGAELAVLNTLSNLDIKFDFLAVEMDVLQLVSFFDIRKRINRIIESRIMLKKLELQGYLLVHQEEFNFFWKLSRQI